MTTPVAMFVQAFDRDAAEIEAAPVLG